MKRKTFIRALVSLAVILLAANAFATTIHLSKPVVFNGKQIKPGDYKVAYTGSGPEVQVTLSQGKNTIATAPARLEDRSNKAIHDAVVSSAPDGGAAETVTEIQLANKKQVLVLSSGEQASGNMGK
jgi:flagellar basal body-associated protein FliL